MDPPKLAFGLETAASLAWPPALELPILTVVPSKAEWHGAAGPRASPTSPRTRRGTIAGRPRGVLEQAAAPLRRARAGRDDATDRGPCRLVIVDTAQEMGRLDNRWRPRAWSDRGSVPRLGLGGSRRPGSLCRPRRPSAVRRTRPDRHGRVGRRDVGRQVRGDAGFRQQPGARRSRDGYEPDMVARLHAR